MAKRPESCSQGRRLRPCPPVAAGGAASSMNMMMGCVDDKGPMRRIVPFIVERSLRPISYLSAVDKNGRRDSRKGAMRRSESLHHLCFSPTTVRGVVLAAAHITCTIWRRGRAENARCFSVSITESRVPSPKKKKENTPPPPQKNKKKKQATTHNFPPPRRKDRKKKESKPKKKKKTPPQKDFHPTRIRSRVKIKVSYSPSSLFLTPLRIRANESDEGLSLIV